MVWSETHCVREVVGDVSDGIFVLLMISSLGGNGNPLWSGGGRLLSISSFLFSFHNVQVLFYYLSRRGEVV